MNFLRVDIVRRYLLFSSMGMKGLTLMFQICLNHFECNRHQTTKKSFLLHDEVELFEK